MRILNFGSLNIDYVYRVDAFVEPGETKSAKSLLINCGGKGLNQSIAAARAGNEVYHAGLCARDGDMLYEKLRENHVRLDYLARADGVSGHAIIEVDDAGQNRILLHGGANMALTEAFVDETLDAFGAPGLVLLQNETNLVGYIMEQAKKRGLLVAFNAAPMNARVRTYPLGCVDWLIVNEVEGAAIAGCERIDGVLPALREKYPACNILLTLGRAGAVAATADETCRVGSFSVQAVDTTAAGDTFSGYFLYAVLHGESLEAALTAATAASALCVTRPGAADSVPLRAEVEETLATHALGALTVTRA